MSLKYSRYRYRARRNIFRNQIPTLSQEVLKQNSHTINCANNVNNINSYDLHRKLHRRQRSKQRKGQSRSNTSVNVNNFFYTRSLIEGVKVFLLEGNVHGFKNVMNTSKSTYERVFWLIVCILCFSLCLFNISVIWQEWRSSEFNIVLDDMYTPIYDIPFPSVVICPIGAVKKSIVDVSNTNDTKLLRSASLLCPDMNNEKELNDSGDIDDDIINMLSASTPSCEETVIHCFWNTFNNKYETFDCCNDLFKPVITMHGVCFGFNTFTSLPKSILTEIVESDKFIIKPHESTYSTTTIPELSNKEFYPRRVLGDGNEIGLKIEIFYNTTEHQYTCNGAEVGFNVLIDSPMENSVENSYSKIPLGKRIHYDVTPSRISTKVSMKTLKPSQRNCYFQGEKKLKYLHHYTQNNCILDCKTQNVALICKCIPFYYKPMVPSTRICYTNQDMTCVNRVKENIKIESVREYYSKISTKPLNLEYKTYFANSSQLSCSCLEECEDISFSYKNSYSDMKEEFSANNYNNVSYKKVSILSVHFQNDQFYGRHRELKHENMDLLSSCGGVFGLFLGCSLISLFEIVFYFCLKPTASYIHEKITNKICDNNVFPYLP